MLNAVPWGNSSCLPFNLHHTQYYTWWIILQTAMSLHIMSLAIMIRGDGVLMSVADICQF